MMKIAICLSGQAREWKRCYSSWLGALSHLRAEIDFFIHFWDYNSMPRQVWTENADGKVVYYDDVPLTNDEKAEIVSTLKPKKYVFEPKLTVQPHFHEISNPIAWWTLDQFNGIMKAAHLKRTYEAKTKTKYNVVLRARSDLLLTEKLDIAQVPVPNSLYITHPMWDKEWNSFRISDIIFWGDSPSYDQAAAYYDHMPFIDAKYVTNDDTKLVYPPEVAFYYYLKSVGMNIQQIWPEMKIVRSKEYLKAKGRLDHYETL